MLSSIFFILILPLSLAFRIESINEVVVVENEIENEKLSTEQEQPDNNDEEPPIDEAGQAKLF